MRASRGGEKIEVRCSRLLALPPALCMAFWAVEHTVSLPLAFPLPSPWVFTTDTCDEKLARGMLPLQCTMAVRWDSVAYLFTLLMLLLLPSNCSLGPLQCRFIRLVVDKRMRLGSIDMGIVRQYGRWN